MARQCGDSRLPEPAVGFLPKKQGMPARRADSKTWSWRHVGLDMDARVGPRSRLPTKPRKSLTDQHVSTPEWSWHPHCFSWRQRPGIVLVTRAIHVDSRPRHVSLRTLARRRCD